jgi:hypothetical protein
MYNFSREFLEKTIRVWQPYYDTPLTIDDAREIATNMVALSGYIFDLEKKYKNCAPPLAVHAHKEPFNRSSALENAEETMEDR